MKHQDKDAANVDRFTLIYRIVPLLLALLSAACLFVGYGMGYSPKVMLIISSLFFSSSFFICVDGITSSDIRKYDSSYRKDMNEEQ